MASNFSYRTIRQLGFGRWLLRECVRANPFYVVSAALFGYGIFQLTTRIDPKAGAVASNLAAVALIHAYELCLLGAAAIVLTRRRSGGGDLHGLTLVAALFMAGSFLLLNQLITIWEYWGLAMVGGALVLAWVKLWCYSRLPGLRLPLNYRLAAIGVLAGHAVSTVLGDTPVAAGRGLQGVQGLAWMAGRETNPSPIQ